MVDFNALNDKWKRKWLDAKIGFADSDPKKPKFFMIWAYLTVSGFHHVGHMRGYSYADAIARYKRMNGFNVLLCAGGHASGNSAVAKAKKVAEKDKETISYYKGMGLSDKDLKSISTPECFVDFFSKRYVSDYEDYGFLGDWRRFTVTTFPDYNKFIEWQFKKLNKLKLLVQKPYYATYSLVSGPVAVDPSEMDLQKGGNAEKVEFTLIKLQYEKNKQFVVVATLRPETMFGQTNVWIDPKVEYVKVIVQDETWIVSKECAEKLQYQKDDVEVVGKIKGKELVGKFCHAPAVDRDVIVLPSRFCNPDIGTGIVTSVPSDAPYDYIALRDLQDSKEECEKFGLDYDVVKNIEIIPIIQSKGFGKFAGKEIVEKLGIKSQDDSELLEKATKEIYKKGFHTGVMLETCGKYAGMKVEEAKDSMKKDLIKAGSADVMYDLSEEVICREGGKVIIKRVDDQWFIKYSDKKLKDMTKKYISRMNILPETFAKNLPRIIDWFDDRACARQGRWLGTKLPFDDSYTIEPIADSTLYSIYYLVSLYVNQGKLKLENLTEKFFDYVFLGEGKVKDVAYETGVDEGLLEHIKSDVSYWYPLDLNLGGKEHQTVHFPVFLMNHAAVLPENMQPRSIFSNWWVVATKGKISKSKGGAKSIQDESKTYSVDAIRLFYANIASPFVDIEFNPEDLQNYRSRLEKIYYFVKQFADSKQDKESFIDSWLESQFNKRLQVIVDSMDRFEFKNATDEVYFHFFKDLQWYAKRGGSNKRLLDELLKKWVLAMTPFTPFVAEELNEMLDGKQLAAVSGFPKVEAGKINEKLSQIEELISNTNNDVMSVLKLAKVDKPKKLTFFVSANWKYSFFEDLRKKLEETRNIGELMKHFTSEYSDHKQEVSKIIQRIIKNPVIEQIINNQKEEFEGLSDARDFFKKSYGCDVDVVMAEDSKHAKASQAAPRKVAIVVE